MKRSGDQALDQALVLHRAPDQLGAIRHMDLPKDLQTLLRIAAGDSEVATQAAQLTDESPESLREVATFYLQQLLFADDGDSYRVLGVNSDAPDEQIRTHYRLLVRWLHPDRNSDQWETVFAERVNMAWHDLRTPTRRNAYDLTRGAEDEQPSNRPGEDRQSLIRMPVPSPMLSTRTVRWLPTLALGSFGLFAIVALGLLYKLQVMDQEERQPAVSSVRDEPAQTQFGVVAPTIGSASLPLATPPNNLPIVSLPAPSPTPAPTSISVSTPTPAPTPAVAAVALSKAVMPAPSQPELIAEAVEAPAATPLPQKSIDRVRVAQVARAKTTRRETETRSQTVAAVSTNVSNPAPMEITSQAISGNSTQAPTTDSQMTESLATANSQPTRQDVSFQTRQESPALIDDRIAASLISRFSQAYANGDMDRLMQLFTHDAQNGHGDRRAIAEDYRRLFQTTDRRRIAVSDMSWLTVNDGATIIASFETEVVPRGKVHGEHATGDIRFDLRQEDGELRIYRLSHDNRRS